MSPGNRTGNRTARPGGRTTRDSNRRPQPRNRRLPTTARRLAVSVGIGVLATGPMLWSSASSASAQDAGVPGAAPPVTADSVNTAFTAFGQRTNLLWIVVA